MPLFPIFFFFALYPVPALICPAICLCRPFAFASRHFAHRPYIFYLSFRPSRAGHPGRQSRQAPSTARQVRRQAKHLPRLCRQAGFGFGPSSSGAPPVPARSVRTSVRWPPAGSSGRPCRRRRQVSPASQPGRLVRRLRFCASIHVRAASKNQANSQASQANRFFANFYPVFTSFIIFLLRRHRRHRRQPSGSDFVRLHLLQPALACLRRPFLALVRLACRQAPSSDVSCRTCRAAALAAQPSLSTPCPALFLLTLVSGSAVLAHAVVSLSSDPSTQPVTLRTRRHACQALTLPCRLPDLDPAILSKPDP